MKGLMALALLIQNQGKIKQLKGQPLFSILPAIIKTQQFVRRTLKVIFSISYHNLF